MPKYDIKIYVQDSNNIRNNIYEGVSGNSPLEVLQNFILAFNRIIQQLHEEELDEERNKGINDDIPF